jgi:hypothetical protein
MVGFETQLQSLVAAASSLLLVYNKRASLPMADYKEGEDDGLDR